MNGVSLLMMGGVVEIDSATEAGFAFPWRCRIGVIGDVRFD